MRISAFFFVGMAGLFLSAAQAAPNPDAKAKAFEKKVVNATQWKDIFATLQGKLPGNIIKDMEAATNGVPFPTIRTQKSGFVLSEPNGAHLHIEFGKEGTVFFNGKEWLIQPLASAQDEINRVAAFLNLEKKVRSSWLDSVVSSAYADSGGSSSVAAAAHVAAVGATASACGGDKLSSNLNKNCTLLAAPVKVAGVNQGNVGLTKDDFLPVELMCPESKTTGTLTLIYKNKFEQATRIQSIYSNGSIAKVSYSIANRNSPFKIIADIDFTNEKDPKVRELGKELSAKGDVLKFSVCSGEEKSKQIFYASLEDNKSKLNSAKIDDTSPSTNSSQNQEAL